MEIHREYYKAGSDIVLANTFGANALKFHDDRYGLKEIITAAITNARKVADVYKRQGMQIQRKLSMTRLIRWQNRGKTEQTWNDFL